MTVRVTGTRREVKKETPNPLTGERMQNKILKEKKKKRARAPPMGSRDHENEVFDGKSSNSKSYPYTIDVKAEEQLAS